MDEWISFQFDSASIITFIDLKWRSTQIPAKVIIETSIDEFAYKATSVVTVVNQNTQVTFSQVFLLFLISEIGDAFHESHNRAKQSKTYEFLCALIEANPDKLELNQSDFIQRLTSNFIMPLIFFSAIWRNGYIKLQARMMLQFEKLRWMRFRNWC